MSVAHDADEPEAVAAEVLDRIDEQLLQLVDVRRQPHNQVAGARLVVEVQAQRLQVDEDALADLDDHRLADDRHQVLVHVAEEGVGHRDHDDRQTDRQQQLHRLAAEHARHIQAAFGGSGRPAAQSKISFERHGFARSEATASSMPRDGDREQLPSA
jgi:hypothetical protein